MTAGTGPDGGNGIGRQKRKRTAEAKADGGDKNRHGNGTEQQKQKQKQTAEAGTDGKNSNKRTSRTGKGRQKRTAGEGTGGRRGNGRQKRERAAEEGGENTPSAAAGVRFRKNGMTNRNRGSRQ